MNTTFPITYTLGTDLTPWPKDKTANQIFATQAPHTTNPIDENKLVIILTNPSDQPLVPNGTSWIGKPKPQFILSFDDSTGKPPVSYQELGAAKMTFKDPTQSALFHIHQPMNLQAVKNGTVSWIIEPTDSNQAIFQAHGVLEVVIEFLYTFTPDISGYLNINHQNMPGYDGGSAKLEVNSLPAPHPEVSYFLIDRSLSDVTIDYGQYYWLYWKTYDSDYCKLSVTEGGQTQPIGDQYPSFGQIRIDPDTIYLQTVYTLQIYANGVTKDFEQPLTVTVAPPVISDFPSGTLKITMDAKITLTWKATSCSHVEISDGTNTHSFSPETTQADFTPTAPSTTYTIKGFGALEENGEISTDTHEVTIDWGQAIIKSFTHELSVDTNGVNNAAQTSANFTWETEYAKSCTLYEIVNTQPQALKSALQQTTVFKAPIKTGFVERAYLFVIEGYQSPTANQITLTPPFVDIDIICWAAGSFVYNWSPSEGIGMYLRIQDGNISYQKFSPYAAGDNSYVNTNNLYLISPDQSIVQYNISKNLNSDISVANNSISFDLNFSAIASLTTDGNFIIIPQGGTPKKYAYQYSENCPHPSIFSYLGQTKPQVYIFNNDQQIYYRNNMSTTTPVPFIDVQTEEGSIVAMTGCYNNATNKANLYWIEQQAGESDDSTFSLYTTAYSSGDGPPSDPVIEALPCDFVYGLNDGNQGLCFGYRPVDHSSKGLIDASTLYFVENTHEPKDPSLNKFIISAYRDGKRMTVANLTPNIQPLSNSLVVTLKSNTQTPENPSNCERENDEKNH